VTFTEYDHFCDAMKREKPGDVGWGRGKRPVINVSWRDATLYCDWLAKETGQPYRLPSEAEWEYACRAGTTTRYAFGDAITPKDANYSESKLGKTTEVGSYPPNAWGLYDMHGNVWEWVEDVWHESYEGAPVDCAAWTDSEGKSSSRRVFRGGSWYYRPRFLRSASRIRVGSVVRDFYLGFRVARTLD
jgi:formylglycine-generating enzyme required for sulfatase activity